MEVKGSKIKTIIIIILCMIIVGLLGFILYEKKLDNQITTLPVEKEKTAVKKVDIKSDIVTNAMNSFDHLSLLDEDIYKTGEFDISNMTKEQLVATASNAVYDLGKEYIKECDNSSKGKVVSINTLNSLLEKYVLDKKITLEDVKNVKTGGYTVENDGILIEGACGDEISFEDYSEKNIVKAETEEDYLYIYEKVAFAKYNDINADQPTINYYKDYSRNNLMEKNKSPLPETETKDSLKWDLYNTYKYTFKKANNNYYFQNIKFYE